MALPALSDLVLETSTSTGTGNLTTARSGGYARGAEAFGVGDKGSLNPIMFIVNKNALAAEWEVVACYWADATTLVRKPVPLRSSNGGAPVDFTNGTKNISNDLPAANQVVGPISVRYILPANATIYVRVDGNDANTGGEDTPGGALRTIEAACKLAASFDCSIYNCSISLGNGTWTTPVGLPLMIGSGTFVLKSTSGDPTLCTISTTDASAVLCSKPVTWWISKIGVASAGAAPIYECLNTANGAIFIVDGVRFGPCARHQCLAEAGGSIIFANHYTIAGGATSHWHANRGGFIQAAGVTVTLVGTPAFTNAFAVADSGGKLFTPASFVGAATGKRFNVLDGGIISGQGNDLNYYPGSLPGTGSLGTYGDVLWISGTQAFGETAGTYRVIVTSNGNNAILCGNATDPGNYYNNDSHYFRSVAGTYKGAFRAGLSVGPITTVGDPGTGGLWVSGRLGFCLFGSGAGGSVTQLTNKGTTVQLDKPTGEIIMSGASLAAGALVGFTFLNQYIGGNCMLILSHKGGGAVGNYEIYHRCALGSANITIRNRTAGALGEAVVIQFAVFDSTVS